MSYRALVEDFPFLAIVGAYAIAAFLLSSYIGLPEDFRLILSLARWRLSGATTFLVAFIAFFGLLTREVVGRSNSVLAIETWRATARQTFPTYKTLNYFFILLVLPTLASTFTAFKVSIPDFIPFGPWDIRFAQWDRTLHFGYEPWQLLHPLLGHAMVTKALDLVYYSWFPVVWLTLVWQAWHGSRDSATRSQFLVTFALCWILIGSLAATLLSSAGPIYYGLVTGNPDPYVALKEYLTAVDVEYGLRAVWAHDVLWRSFVDRDIMPFSGISAMPSLHVSMAFLLALLGFKLDRRLGCAYAAFALLIFLGSIELAWHYAIDGYVAVLLTILLWWVSGGLVRVWRSRLTERNLPSPFDASGADW